MHNFRSDDSQKGSEPSDGAEWVAPFDNFQYVKDLWASNFYWDAHYSLIHLTNTALQTADSLKLVDVNSEVNIAEARFFRAFSYFDMVRTFGDVPKIDFRIYNAAQANIAKSPAAQIYALIDADFICCSTFAPGMGFKISWPIDQWRSQSIVGQNLFIQSKFSDSPFTLPTGN
jgi:hypothetical protein